MEGETAVMKAFRDLLTRDFSDLLDSWVLIFAIVPFGALIFCGMYVGQFILGSTLIGVLLMFVFPLLGFAFLYTIRKKYAPGRDTGAGFGYAASTKPEVIAQSPMVVVYLEASSETDMQPMFTLRRLNALGNAYLQQGLAPSVIELQEQVGDQSPGVNWTNVVSAPPKSLTGTLPRADPRPPEPIQASSR